MGVNLTELLHPTPISFQDLKGKIIAIDTSLFLYQFLSSIRQRDGGLFTTSEGVVTSHLIGLFSRTTLLMKKGIKMAYVFDGEPPQLKLVELQRRKEIKIESQKKYDEANKRKDEAEMRKYAGRTSRLTPQMIEQSKEVLELLGIPLVQAPSEAEAQASFLVKNTDAFAVASQDTDCLLYGTPRLVRNLSATARRKRPGMLASSPSEPEILELSETLNLLGLDHDQLICLGMLVGTDFNVGGIKGLGPKTGLKIIKTFGKDFDGLFRHVKWNEFFGASWKEVFNLIRHMPVTKDYSLTWKKPQLSRLQQLLIHTYEFSEDRVLSSLAGLDHEPKQKGLGDFLQ
ncbi:MAG TPA: flap endonuclease-1 [Candidatus Nanoarchaeia archaeon]|nr:flap endonuclease-1 [Candidatus Nanoarchaeia archaeon]